MFLRPFKIKSNAATKGSDRKHVRREISTHYPHLPQAQLDSLLTSKVAMATVRVTTHSGAGVTVYVVEGEPLFFEEEGRVYPTVYTLWRVPEMLGYVSTWPQVLPRLQGGADLMLPGVVTAERGGSSIEGITRGQAYAVNLVGNRSAVGVGVALMSTVQMLTNGMRGKGFRILHLYGDHLWEMGSKLHPPMVAMETSSKTPEITDETVHTVTEEQPTMECSETEMRDLGLKSDIDDLNQANPGLHAGKKVGSEDGISQANISAASSAELSEFTKTESPQSESCSEAQSFVDESDKSSTLLVGMSASSRSSGESSRPGVGQDTGELSSGESSRPGVSQNTSELSPDASGKPCLPTVETASGMEKESGLQTDPTLETTAEKESEEVVSKPTSGGSVAEATEGLCLKESEVEEDPVKVMDDLLMECFLQALKTKALKTGIPMLTSTFYRSCMMEICPSSMKLDIKKSSYKKLSRFLQEMCSQGLVVVEETGKGVESITAVDFKHPLLKSYSPKLLAERSHDPTPAATPTSSAAATNVPKAVKVVELYMPSHKLLPLFVPLGLSKGSVLDQKTVREVVTSYVKSNELVSPSNPRQVRLDPLLSDALHRRGEPPLYELPWQEVIARVLAEMRPAFSISTGSGEPILRKGRVEPIRLTLAQRTGNKKVTLVDNLETYSIPPTELAHTMQRMVAASATVSETGGKVGTQQVLVQGNAVKSVAKVLEENYGVPLKFIEAIDKIKPPKKKTGKR